MFGKNPPDGRRLLLVVVVLIFTAGAGGLLAFGSRLAPASLTDTTTEPAPTTTIAPTPDPAPTPSPAPKPAPKSPPAAHAPAPTYHPPTSTPTSHEPVRIQGSAPSAPKPRQVQRSRRPRHVKPSVTPSAPAATKSPDAAKAGVAGVQTVRTGLVSPATGSNAARILLLAGFVLGALLVAIATVLPAIAARFTLPGRVVIEHQMDLKILGVALSIVAVLVYVLGTTGH